MDLRKQRNTDAEETQFVSASEIAAKRSTDQLDTQQLDAVQTEYRDRNPYRREKQELHGTPMTPEQEAASYREQTKIKCVLFKKSTHHSTSFPPVSAPILTNRNETGNIDRFDNSQTVRTMMLCFVFSGYYNRVPKRCQAFRFKFYRNFTSYTAFLWLFLSVFSFFLILD